MALRSCKIQAFKVVFISAKDEEALDQANYKYVIYDQVKPNPSVENVEEVVKIYQNEVCHSIIAFVGEYLLCNAGVSISLLELFFYSYCRRPSYKFDCNKNYNII